MGRAVIYTRVSTDKQEAEGDSLQAQERDCRADCERFGDTVVGVCSDVFTGHESMDQRKGLWGAIHMIERGEANTLVVKRISRANRDITDNLVMFRYIREADGHLRSVVEGPIPNTHMGEIMLGLHGFQAAQDWEYIREQTGRGRQSRVERGRPLASVPLFGYHRAALWLPLRGREPLPGEVLREDGA
jgi:site-specific DNA recombinase